MKTLTSLLIACFACLSFFAQTDLPAGTEKGAIPITSHQSPVTNTTLAVVGISDYQAVQIPDLHFADRDAMEFASWLRSPAGGSLPAENITLLTNGEATSGNFAMGLTGLIDDCKPGDQAIIYFSGHGDVETKTIFQLGFLLCHDSPPNNYMAGAFNLVNLQAVISTLAANNVRVLVVTDACRAGKLAGASVNGPQLTSANLAKQFANELKILSCQPNELSLESEQWGGGRGAFSYHLLEGLTGLADRSDDGQVALLEIGRYLEETVPVETNPHPQMPFTVGDRMAGIAQVDAAALAILEKDRASRQGTLKATGMRAFGETLLEGVDSATQAQYQAFLMALEKGELIEPAGSSAEDYYQKLSHEVSLKPLWGLMRRNFAAALLNEVQQALNALLESDPYETNAWHFNPDKYDKYPLYLQRSIDLLGEGHYMHRSLLAKKLYFDGYLFTKKTVNMSDVLSRDSLWYRAKQLLLQSAEIEPSAAYVYHALSHLYFALSPPRTDSMMYWTQRAQEYSPAWLLPYLDLSYEFHLSLSDLKQAEYWLKKALEVDAHSYVVLERLSWLYQWLNRTQASLDLCDTMIAMRPDLFNAYATKGVTLMMRNEYAEAEKMFAWSSAREPGYGNWGNYYQFQLLVRTRGWRKAKEKIDAVFLNDQLDNHEIAALTSNFIQPMLFNNHVKEVKNYCIELLGLNVYATDIALAKLGLGKIRLKILTRHQKSALLTLTWRFYGLYDLPAGILPAIY